MGTLGERVRLNISQQLRDQATQQMDLQNTPRTTRKGTSFTPWRTEEKGLENQTLNTKELLLEQLRARFTRGVPSNNPHPQFQPGELHPLPQSLGPYRPLRPGEGPGSPPPNRESVLTTKEILLQQLQRLIDRQDHDWEYGKDLRNPFTTVDPVADLRYQIETPFHQQGPLKMVWDGEGNYRAKESLSNSGYAQEELRPKIKPAINRQPKYR